MAVRIEVTPNASGIVRDQNSSYKDRNKYLGDHLRRNRQQRHNVKVPLGGLDKEVVSRLNAHTQGGTSDLRDCHNLEFGRF
jgi:hypothetical protein